MFIFEEDKGKLLLISEKIGSDMSQSKRASFLKNQYKYFVVYIYSWGRRASETVVKEWYASINFNLTRYV